MDNIKLNTLAGESFENLIELLLSDLNVDFERNKKISSEGYESDFVVELNGKTCTIEVTSTSQAETFIKKRWRYIDQVGQAKSEFKENSRTTAIFFGIKRTLQQSEEIILSFVFDSCLWLEEEMGYEIDKETKKEVKRLGRSLNDSDYKSMLSPSLYTGLTKLLKDNLQKTSMQSATHKDWLTKCTGLVEPCNKRSYLRRAIIKMSLLEESNIHMLYKSGYIDLSIEDTSILDLACIEYIKTTLGKVKITDKEISLTISSGLSLEHFKTIMSSKGGLLISSLSTQAKSGIDKEKLKQTLSKVGNKRELKRALIKNFSDKSDKRMWVLDIILSALNSSVSELNRIFTMEFGHIGVSNPIKNIITKTSLSDSIIRNVGTDAFFDMLSEICVQQLEGKSISIDDIYFRLTEKRIKNLFLQNAFNPARILLTASLVKDGWKVVEHKQDNIFFDLNVPGRMKKVEGLLFCTKDKEQKIVKVISAYESGCGHKTNEMAARRRIMGSIIGGVFCKDHLPTTEFIYEGIWPSKNLNHLANSGWHRVANLWDSI